MGSENPDDVATAVVVTDEDQQEIGGLINSDGEEVEFSDLGEFFIFCFFSADVCKSQEVT